MSIQSNLSDRNTERTVKGHFRETWLEVPAQHPSPHGAEDRQNPPTQAVSAHSHFIHNRTDLTSFVLLLQLSQTVLKLRLSLSLQDLATVNL